MKCNINNCETCKLETCELYETKLIRKEKENNYGKCEEM